ncbi:MAG TPA: reverse transcriptase [Bacteroidales bacterium]|nr:reverse transcriptase [Bacteroidales bacterium]
MKTLEPIDLISQIANTENLLLAFYKARKTKDHRPEVQNYRKNLWQNLAILKNEIETGNINVGNYNYFTITDPKKREICAASFHERILHHAIMNVCHIYFEEFQTENSFASRINRGTYAALELASQYNAKYQWYLKLDFRKYFNSINREILINQLYELIPDTRVVLMFSKIIYSDNPASETGLPIGNLTSQYFANHFLAIADKFAQNELKTVAYIRYMDDVVIWHTSKYDLMKIERKYRNFVQNTLKLNLKPACLNTTSQPLAFLGYKLTGNKIALLKRSKSRFEKQLIKKNRLLEKNVISQNEFVRCANSLVAFVKHAETLEYRKTFFEKINKGNYCMEALTV